MISFQDNARERGRADAERDVAAGKPRLFWGTRGSWGAHFQNLFRARFSVHIEHVDCAVWPGLIEYREAYNAVTIAYIDRTYGVSAFSQAKAEVDRFREDSYRRFFESEAHGDKNEET